jgi:putative peptide zinc metalloprotease protein
MSEETKKIVLPAFLMRRFEAFRIVKDGQHSYLIRDKVQGKVHDFDAWQFFVLEVLPGCETLDKLQVVFRDRFDRELRKQDFDELIGSIADRKLFEESALQHPLLAPFLRKTFDVQDDKAVARPAAESAQAARATTSMAPAPAPKAPPPPAAAAGAGAPPDRNKDLAAGVQDALGMDWRTSEKMIGLFDPRPLLRLIGPVLKPLRHLVYGVPLLLLAALMVVWQYSHLLSEDVRRLAFDLTLIEHLLIMFVTLHVATTLTISLVADAYQVSVDKLGIKLVLGFIPRWVVKMTGAERMTRPQVMWLHGSALLIRLVVFSVGVLLWFNTRDAQTRLSDLGVVLMFGAGAGLLLESGNPLVKSNAYYLLSAFLNEPHLRGKAYAALLNKFKGGVYRASDSTLLALYALVSSTYVIVVIAVVGWMIAKFLLGDLTLGGSAILVILGFTAFMLWSNYAGLKSFGDTYARQVQFDRWRNRTLHRPDEAEGEIKTPKTHYWRRAGLVALLLALFLPYPYDPGGPFLTFPSQRQALSTDTPGLIEAVYFDGGEAVKAGTTLARLSQTDYQGDIRVLAARIEEQRAVVRNLRTLPRPEDVKVAEQALEIERTRERYSRERVPRLEKLYKEGAVTFDEFDAARKEHATDESQVVKRQAELALVKVPVTIDQIAEAEARLAALIEEKANLESKVDRTVLKMPFDGSILSLHLKDKVNTFLERGQPFAVLENTGTVTIEIEVPEGDIRYVKVGTEVRARAVSFFDDREFLGKVSLIDRNVTPKPTGNVVKVHATIANDEGLLRTGMAGRAKIEGETMPVWRAFTMGIVRFFQVQVWSWLP